jgi:hypothetical protein
MECYCFIKKGFKMSTLTVTVKQRTTKVGETTSTGVEGTYQLPNSTTARIARKDGTTLFPNRGSLSQAAKRLAAVLGWESELVDPQKKVAKKSMKTAQMV